MTRRRDEEFSISPLPRERRSAKIQRYMLALTIAAVLTASLLVIVSILGVAVAPLFERGEKILTGKDTTETTGSIEGGEETAP